MNISQQNIRNLKDLWTMAGQQYDALVRNRHFNSVSLPGSQWPSRIWFDRKLEEQSSRVAIRHLQLSNNKISVSVFDDPAAADILKQQGLTKTSEQCGMNLHLQTEYPDRQELHFEKVENMAAAQLWSLLFEAAFNYSIPAGVVYKTSAGADYYLTFKDKLPIGTALLFASRPEVIGIHSMGVTPAWRRQGLAEIMMQKLLHISGQKGYRYATLQASAAGKGLYEKFGFQPAFLMENYQLKNT